MAAEEHHSSVSDQHGLPHLLCIWHLTAQHCTNLQRNLVLYRKKPLNIAAESFQLFCFHLEQISTCKEWLWRKNLLCWAARWERTAINIGLGILYLCVWSGKWLLFLDENPFIFNLSVFLCWCINVSTVLLLSFFSSKVKANTVLSPNFIIVSDVPLSFLSVECVFAI